MFKWLAGGLCLVLAGGGEAAAQVANSADTAWLFGVREGATSVDLSPDGTTIFYIAPTAGSSSVAFTANIATGEPKPFLNAGQGTEKLSWCRFVTDQRLICRYRAAVRTKTACWSDIHDSLRSIATDRP